MTEAQTKRAEELAELFVTPIWPRKYEDLHHSCETRMVYEIRDEVAAGFEQGYAAAIADAQGLADLVHLIITNSQHDITSIPEIVVDEMRKALKQWRGNE